jgi:hypothetical protein
MNLRTLLKINKGLKRRLVFGADNNLVDALGMRACAEFRGTDLLRIFDIDESRLADKNKRYNTQIEAGKGVQFISDDEAKLILGYDFFKAEDELNVLTMLKACEGGMRGANAYFLGLNLHTAQGAYSVPIAYLKISEPQHASLAIDRDDHRFRACIKRLKA